jgi:hypothetical protein
MKIIETLNTWIVAIRDAKNAGLTNDGGALQFFRNEYKKDPIAAYEYWLSTHSLPDVK